MNYIDEINKRIACKDGKKVIEKALHNVYFYGSYSSKTLARELLIPVPVLTALKNECKKLGLWEQGGGLKTTGKGKQYFEEDLGFGEIRKDTYLHLMKDERERELLIHELSDKYRNVFDSRPIVDVTIDQAKCTVETSFRRAMLCLCNGSLIGKKVLCVGDDDLVSIAMGLLLKHIFHENHKSKTEICVFEMDERYVKYIDELSDSFSLPVQCERVDLKDPLPLPFLNYFDSFFSDPPYTVQGASLFLSRGISALKKEFGLNIFFSFANKSINETYALQKCFQLHGLVVKQIYHTFNEYEGASLLGNRGQMIILETTEQTRAVIPVDKNSNRSIYTRDNKPKNKKYSCKKCKKTFLMSGTEEFLTIEELKSNGCPFCGYNKFEQLNNHTKQEIHLLSKPLGRHILADFYSCQVKNLDDTDYIQNAMRNAAIKAKATIVQEDFHKFSPWGVSGVIVIQESHLTIHTWPEYSYASVDLFTCGEDVDAWTAFDYLKTMLKSDHVEFSDISRGHLSDIQYFDT